MGSRDEASQEVKNQIFQALENGYERAEENFNNSPEDIYVLSIRLRTALKSLSDASSKASAAFTNIVTCLAIKAANRNIDIRYHQIQIQSATDRPAGFNFRGVSEQIVSPWLSNHAFEGAQSGWQTRTLERPKPYTSEYNENIAHVKEPFLAVFDEIEKNLESAIEALSYLIFLQIIYRETKKISLSEPRTSDIQLIIKVFREHFFYNYKASSGASRLPVLALYAVYQVLIQQLDRYKDMELKPLEAHSAADSQTGAVGDIEVVKINDRTIFEAIEVKHNIALSESIIQTVAKKIMDKPIDRYYILTTHAQCEPSDDLAQLIAQVKALYSCQLIANGVIPSLKYYLRLLSDPSLVFPNYVKLLTLDKSIKHEHREVWNTLVTRF